MTKAKKQPATKTPLFTLKKPIEISISVAISATLAVSVSLAGAVTLAFDKIHALNAPAIVSVLQLQGKMHATNNSEPVYQLVRQKDKIALVKQGDKADIVITCPESLPLGECLAIADEQ